jgi:hypothetical protein
MFIGPIIGLIIGYCLKAIWDRIKKDLAAKMDEATSTKLARSWNATYPGTDEFQEHIEINKQLGSNVQGTIKDLKGKSSGRMYAFNGTIRDSVLVAVYEPIDKSLNDRGCFSLRAINNGDSYSGHMLYLNQNSEVKPTSYRWDKI